MANGIKRNRPSQQDQRKHRLMTMYKMTLDQYYLLIDGQYYQCPICNESLMPFTRNTHIDHDHETGRVRGILCGKCNIGLGHFKDNPEFLQNAIEYIKRNQ